VSTVTPGQRVTRDDIEQKLREITGEVSDEVDTARNIAVTVGIAGVVLIVVLAFLLGRRRGKKRTTIVEVRRI
jgi:hypothetical protein